LIVGPSDPTDHFSWPGFRIERDSAVLAAGTLDDPVAFIDVRDLTEFMIRLCEDGALGAHSRNVTR
jgi:2'-hydroxyisoflavone reductase